MKQLKKVSSIYFMSDDAFFICYFNRGVIDMPVGKQGKNASCIERLCLWRQSLKSADHLSKAIKVVCTIV